MILNCTRESLPMVPVKGPLPENSVSFTSPAILLPLWTTAQRNISDVVLRASSSVMVPLYVRASVCVVGTTPVAVTAVAGVPVLVAVAVVPGVAVAEGEDLPLPVTFPAGDATEYHKDRIPATIRIRASGTPTSLKRCFVRGL